MLLNLKLCCKTLHWIVKKKSFYCRSVKDKATTECRNCQQVKYIWISKSHVQQAPFEIGQFDSWLELAVQKIYSWLDFDISQRRPYLTRLSDIYCQNGWTRLKQRAWTHNEWGCHVRHSAYWVHSHLKAFVKIYTICKTIGWTPNWMKCDASNVVVVVLHEIGTSFAERPNFNCACVLVKCWPPKSLDVAYFIVRLRLNRENVIQLTRTNPQNRYSVEQPAIRTW